LEKSKNGYISATTSPVAMKFGRLTHFDPIEPSHP